MGYESGLPCRQSVGKEHLMDIELWCKQQSGNKQAYYFDHVRQPYPVHGHRIPDGSDQRGPTGGCCCWLGAAQCHDGDCTC